MYKYMEERNANPQSVYSITQLKSIRRTIIEKTDFFIKMINKYGNPIDITTKAVFLATVAHCYNDEGKYLLIKNSTFFKIPLFSLLRELNEVLSRLCRGLNLC